MLIHKVDVVIHVILEESESSKKTIIFVVKGQVDIIRLFGVQVEVTHFNTDLLPE